MAAPSKVDEFLDLVRKSGVVDEKRLDAYLHKLRTSSTLPDDLGKLAGVLVRDGILTHFQAEQFLLGKWRRFTIGKYKVLERLGSGGMGSVYLCEHKFMRRRVAVKVLPAAKADDPAALERFYREARAVAALDHPNIVRAYDIDQDDKLHFLVMEYVDGSSFQEIIKKHGPMNVTRSVHYMQQAAIGLQHAHQTAGLVHRDIKPGNVLIDRNGIVKILDMGLARFFHDEEDILTKKYDENVLGTADYLAPEQALDSHSVDIRADIYSLGATFYFILSGCTPFTEGTVAQKLIWHQTRTPKPIRNIRPEVPEDLAKVLDKMMAKDPAHRYQTPADVVQALAPWTQQPIPAPPEKEMPRLSPAAMGSETVMMNTPSTPTATTSPPPPVVPLPTPVPQKTPPAARPPVSPVPTPVSPAASPRPAAVAQQPVRAPAAIAPTPLPTPVPGGRSGNGQFAPAPSAPAPAAVKEEAPNWEMLAPKSDSSGNRPTGATSPLPAWLTGNLYYQKFRASKYFWWGVGGAALFFFIFLIVAFSSIGGGKKTNPGNTFTGSKRIVSQSGAKGTFKTIRDALREAQPGDQVVIQDESIEEALLLEGGSKLGKEVTIVGDFGGKPVLWTCPDNPRDGKFISISYVEGLKLKNFTFDGKNRVTELVRFQGNCAGAGLEDVSLTGFTLAGLSLPNCFGKTDERITFSRVRIIAGGERPHGVLFKGTRNMPPSQYLTFSDCRFEGPCKTLIQIETDVLDTEWRRNRFFNGFDAIFYKSARPSYKFGCTFESNTFCDIKRHALHLEDEPIPASFRMTWKNNLFTRMPGVSGLEKYKPATIQPAAIPAQFIWHDDPGLPGNPPPGNRYFRHAFQVPRSTIARAVLNIIVDDESTVWLNGRLIGKTNFDTRHVLAFDVSRDLVPDRNVIAVHAVNKSGPAFLLAQLTYTAADKTVTVISDGSWKSSPNEAPNWNQVAFDEKDWKPAKHLGGYGANEWKNYLWDSAIQDEFKKQFKAIELANNVCDRDCHEGTSLLDVTSIDFRALPADPNKDDFLIYPKGSRLDQLPDKPGVPPE